MQQKGQSHKSSFLQPIYSPRTSYSLHLHQIQQLKTNMTINIDKYILGSMKTQFQKRGKQINLIEFVHYAKKYLKDWNLELYGRETKMDQCLIDIWREIDLDNKDRITWEQFNSKIIQTALSLKSLSSNAGNQAPIFKQLPSPLSQSKHQSVIEKMIYIKQKNKVGYFREQSTLIQFFNTQILPQSSQTKPIYLPQQQLKVQTQFRTKKSSKSPSSQPIAKTIKKQIKVSSYKNTVLDIIFIDDPKYNMMLVSCSDKIVRGYNVSTQLPQLAVQPENQDQFMIHHFSIEIYNMAWDPIGQVLYATGKNLKIYQWMVKTDSQRQLEDIKGHQQMVLVILIMPKLQLLATGGYDGKLILWDIVGQNIKCKYQQHTRAISDIAFHQSLILLFTASYDHKICIWNPYISSLIHKIDNNMSVISLQIIPNTNYLMSLDKSGTLKIRETSRFTQVCSFSILRSQKTQQSMLMAKGQNQKQLSISICQKADSPLCYYFGTDKILAYQYYQIQKSTIQGGVPFNIQYRPHRFLLYIPLKNHMIVWNLLTGNVHNTFYDIVQGDISAFQIIQELKIMVVGDFDGRLAIRNIDKGMVLGELHKLKTSVTHLRFYQIQRTQKEKYLKKTYILFCATDQGDIVVFKCLPKNPFQVYKSISFRRDFGISSGVILTSFEYLNPKNILIAGLSSNQLLFIDVQKSSLLIKLQLGISPMRSFHIICKQMVHYLMVLGRTANLSFYYLPPHSKKYKISTTLQIDNIQRVQFGIYGQKCGMFFIFTEKCQVVGVKIRKGLIDNQEIRKEDKQLRPIWKTHLTQKIRKIILIENQEILVLLTKYGHSIFVLVQTGQIICQLKQNIQKTETLNKDQFQPILHLKLQNDQVYVPLQKRWIQISESEKQNQLQRIIDPNFFMDLMKKNNVKSLNRISNRSWKLNLKFSQHYKNKIKQIQQIKEKIQKNKKYFDRKATTSVQLKISKAIQLQKKWQKDKQVQQQGTKKFIQTQKKKNFIKNPTLTRGSSLGTLNKNPSIHQNQRSIQKLRQSAFSIMEQKDTQGKQYLKRLIKDPMYRLGQALINVNSTDKKAQNFIQFAKLKESLKLPKIGINKLKL